jgi:phage/conjugal plasmid C-4 type zinc finger TraR family protein
MAGGWSRDGAVHEQIDASVEDAVKRARSALPKGGESLAHCAECDAPIPEARRRAVPGVRHCVACQAELDDANPVAGFNRRGSKDSQLR